METNPYSFNVRLAELNINIESRHEYVKRLFSEYIWPNDEPCDVVIRYDDAELTKERENFPGYPEPYYESLLIYRKICTKIIEYRAMLIHSSAISLDGEAYLFTAPSGTGKSTHTRLWREHFGDRALMINDDKPIVRERDGRFFVYGTPYMGQYRLGANIYAPIKAVCIISRGEQNEIERLTAEECISALLNQTLIPSDEGLMDALLSTFEKFIVSVPVYRLRCNISDEAVCVAYNGMKN